MGHEGGMDSGPADAVVLGGLRDTPSLLSDRVTQLGPQPPGQPRPRRDAGDVLGERGPTTKHFTTAPSPFVPHQPQRPSPVRDVAGPGRHLALRRRRDHPTRRARRGPDPGRDHVNDATTGGVDLDMVDGQSFQPEQARRVSGDTLETDSWRQLTVSYTHLTLPTIYSV